MNAYEVIVTYMEPSKALITILANSEDHAKELLTESLSDWPFLEIQEVRKVAETDFTAEDLNPNKTVN
jgi:hypothetical protein